jgi:hypothetical protein
LRAEGAGSRYYYLFEALERLKDRGHGA